MPNCPECGFIHPPTPPGQCPIAKEKKIKEDISQIGSDTVQKYIQAINIKLVEKLKSLDNIRSQKLCADIFTYVEKFK